MAIVKSQKPTSIKTSCTHSNQLYNQTIDQAIKKHIAEKNGSQQAQKKLSDTKSRYAAVYFKVQI